MISRFAWLRLVVGALCFASAGCEPHRSWLRPKDDDEVSSRASDVKAVESDTSKIPSVDSDDKKSSPFFKKGRLSGGLSSEAREIEKNLGVD